MVSIKDMLPRVFKEVSVKLSLIICFYLPAEGM